jgi:hypothetical protein
MISVTCLGGVSFAAQSARPVAHSFAARPVASHSSAMTQAEPMKSHGVRRNFDHFGGRVNAVAVYPWWYGDALLNSYYSSNDLSDSDNASAISPEKRPAATSAPIFEHFDRNEALATMDLARMRAEAALESSPQWASANADLQNALAELTAARDRIRLALSSRADYQAAIEQKKSAEDLATALHERGATVDQTMPAAQRDLQASQSISRIEREAMANDPQLVEARARLQSAVAARQQLQAGLRDQVINDPKWVAARRMLDELR